MNHSSPLVSIIVPSYNYGHFIGETLKDLYNQSFKEWECVIVDDGSSDNTKEVVKAFVEKDSRFKYIYQNNRGLSAARNTGIKHSSGDFFQLLDADDKLESEKLKIHSELLIKNSEVGIVYGEVRYFTTDNPELRMLGVDGKIKKTWMPEVSGKGNGVVRALVKGNIMVVNAPMYRRIVIDKIGVFDEELKALEDWDYWTRAAINGVTFMFDATPGTYALVRSHLGSMIKDKSRMLASNIQYREKLNKELLEFNCSNEIIQKNLKKLEGAKSELLCQAISEGKIVIGWKGIIVNAFKSQFPSVYFKYAWKYTRRYYKGKLLK